MNTLLIAAAIAQTFNLNCAGSAHVGSTQQEKGGRPVNIDKTTNFKRQYRVDLERKIWCEDACTDSVPFAEITPDRLVFSEDDGFVDGMGRVRMSAFVDRRTGAFRSLDSSEQADAVVTIETVATCARAPFTGLPDIKPLPVLKF